MKILYITTVGSTMSFFECFIKELINEGHTVDIATNNTMSFVPENYEKWGCRIFSLSCSRKVLDKGNIKAIRQIKELVKKEKYDIVHCHTPIAATCTRIACRNIRKIYGTKVFYTVHGFHFHKGASLKNWFVYYPIEKICSYFTDKLITINKEDYNLALKKMRSNEIIYVPGVGIDISKFSNIKGDRKRKRREIGVPEDSFLLLSVGELNNNKNHQIVIKAISKIQNKNIHYVIAGKGEKKEYLLELAKKLDVSNQVHLIGFRNDIPELNHAADVFCFPSYREGLGIAAIEAMVCGLPIITSNIHGINDYSQNGLTGYKCAPTDVDGFAKAICDLKDDHTLSERMGSYNKKYVKKYDVYSIIKIMREVYEIE